MKFAGRRVLQDAMRLLETRPTAPPPAGNFPFGSGRAEHDWAGAWRRQGTKIAEHGGQWRSLCPDCLGCGWITLPPTTISSFSMLPCIGKTSLVKSRLNIRTHRIAGPHGDARGPLVRVKAVSKASSTALHPVMTRLPSMYARFMNQCALRCSLLRSGEFYPVFP